MASGQETYLQPLSDILFKYQVFLSDYGDLYLTLMLKQKYLK
jgi:hypothetical protein